MKILSMAQTPTLPALLRPHVGVKKPAAMTLKIVQRERKFCRDGDSKFYLKGKAKNQFLQRGCKTCLLATHMTLLQAFKHPWEKLHGLHNLCQGSRHIYHFGTLTSCSYPSWIKVITRFSTLVWWPSAQTSSKVSIWCSAWTQVSNSTHLFSAAYCIFFTWEA